MRISKRFVLGTAFFLGGAGLVGLGGFALALFNTLQATQESLAEVQEVAELQREQLVDLAGSLQQVNRQVSKQERLSALERSRLSAEIERTKQADRSADLARSLGRLSRRVLGLSSETAKQARLLAQANAREDVELRFRELMSPTVRVNAREEVGSGSILWSRVGPRQRVRTYILTAWHIVEDNASKGAPPLEIDFYWGGEQVRTELGSIVARNIALDVALLEVKGKHTYTQRARLPSRTDLNAIPIFTKVYAIGCPLGYAPLPTSGELTSKDKELDGNHYWMINAPTIFGNSGGGIYTARSRTLIGVLSRISAYKNMIDVAVPHMGLVVPIDKVYDWLDRTRFAFVYRDRLPRTLHASKLKRH